MNVIFTDLDGTLLDAVSYDWHVAHHAVQRVQRAGIPLIFCSAKTRAEQMPIRDALGVGHPFIVENGSAIILADGKVHILGMSADTIHHHLDAIRAETGLMFTGYAQMSDQAIADVTGLSLASATLARQRAYSETIVTPFTPREEQRFLGACHEHGLQCSSGGRFRTVTGANADKGLAVAWLKSWYGIPITTYGIGDSPNDRPMLYAVDHAFLVQRPDGTWHDLDLAQIIHIPLIGPAGFTQAIEMILTP